MDKNAIKKYAVWARRELISRVSQKALQYGISENEIVPASAASVNGVVLSAEEIKQRKALIDQINAKGYEQVMEEVAYTWFNRFIALRFMEVNGYLPSHVRVFTDEDNAFRPQIITEAINLELDGLDMDKVYAWKDANDNDALFKYLIITQCNALSPILPRMFQRINDYTELLFPDNLLREGSAIQRMIEWIPVEDWKVNAEEDKDAVQIIGWMYQYYNSEKKDEVFAALKKNVKIAKDNIPAATQLFTPDWIVRYMVENSLGRLWLERNAANSRGDEDEVPGDLNEYLLLKWKYYVFDLQEDPEVQAQFAEIRKDHMGITPDRIKCIDPCAGSGHILAYMFDVLIRIYGTYGFTTRDAVYSIIQNNMYGLDIDERAAQLAYFAVMMKARQYDRRFFARKNAYGEPDVPQPHIYAIQESNSIDKNALDYFINADAYLQTAMDSIIQEMHDAKEYGSIINITPVDFHALYTRFDEVYDEISMYREAILNELLPLVRVAEALSQQYDAVITNPPYMGSGGMSTKLSDYVKKHYPDSKSDLFAVFIERCGQMTAENRYQAMITQHAWMFLSSYEKLRQKLLQKDTVNMIHLGPRAFEEIGGEVVQTTSFVMRRSRIAGYRGTYCRLVEPTTQQGKEDMFLAGENRYVADQTNFSKIPGTPISYWVTTHTAELFSSCARVENYAQPLAGICTGNNDAYFRMWYEVSAQNIGLNLHSRSAVLAQTTYKWFFHYKGGEFRRWYGNIDYVINYTAQSISNMALNKGFRHDNREYYFKRGITWSKMCSGHFSARCMNSCSMFDSTGTSAFPVPECYSAILGLLNSKITLYFVQILNPTFAIYPNNIGNIPVSSQILNNVDIELITSQCTDLSKNDWDCFETSWDFEIHPLVRLRESMWCHAMGNPRSYILSAAYCEWENECNARFDQIKANEEELNRIFIDIYGLQEELSPDVLDKDVTVRKADVRREIRSLVSYAVGCMFGRYSLDVPGLAYAGGEWDDSKYTTFKADKDSIIPICDDEYFADDIVGRFIRFIEVVYGKETLQENLRFIADALGGSGQPKDVIRNYFLNDFYADHLKVYQKRPIYWLFDSGKKNGFKALVYMHRYQPDTIARMRTDYVHEQQARYRTAIADLEQRIASASTAERVKLSKRLKQLQEQTTEIQSYEEKIHHLADQYIAIDLDDGVKKNYAIFQDVLAKIK